jgi:BirA family transcriptional regulator, biotin operon repressor / biotin---[acetyl-CoA-carboxylase] ligase
VSGILVEGRPAEDWAVLGIGLNVLTAPDQFPAELRSIATSLAAESEQPLTVESALTAVLAALARWMGGDGPELLEAWRGRDALLGERVRWGEGSGVAAGIDDSGSLLVETETGTVALGAGEVHLIR